MLRRCPYCKISCYLSNREEVRAELHCVPVMSRVAPLSQRQLSDLPTRRTGNLHRPPPPLLLLSRLPRLYNPAPSISLLMLKQTNRSAQLPTLFLYLRYYYSNFECNVVSFVHYLSYISMPLFSTTSSKLKIYSICYYDLRFCRYIA